ncbi:MAG: purine-nucleoside phosphorylase [Candidatus Staskawiczbacteria bacterium RIFOXYD2_FULL_37_9]|uniref:Purine-nucleoside phosphorylase n=1 Tax=Candidatus Staskawiczbacteria bacterium RIFOXYB1_FULL_37_44 TaxID=1802223 RepID=A0A1G2IXZ3_9BACT|nr:MAG: purine-nucleoside phosphorylase [Candidatus Staskawiczbacteria bacterium RIFOXYB1_FULL_37_44]OGZ84489.1 MAG: purine-nucleoside phosphorylase [Candidatus Staskawiczbacteria bacterium RIFOXYC1_FULL_37_52]OGZ89230.1 MAG: purine-nucleoside phosphorylase [Candidatus Staskawiczbacteria bacterium RIFOXYC2_FULL_37_19]OGZ89948.1 MAG: purine-nucleoside phosphorylase [Candidatus Staskawiczbacteria bacterium RIFOXYD1_FULL_37_110]OGZ94490.1 MAG: purine-nucleoside phosphorylase [Candidatus Staskawicz
MKKKNPILVSACLLGVNCQYNGESDFTRELLDFLKDRGEFIAICPEVLGGLTIPRDGAEIIGDKVKTVKGNDVTKEFLAGAEKVLKFAKENNVDFAILKAKSPSCGVGMIYDGTFSRKLIEGDGITAALLKKNKIKVLTEKDFIKH